MKDRWQFVTDMFNTFKMEMNEGTIYKVSTDDGIALVFVPRK